MTTTHVLLGALQQVCPTAPGNAQVYADQLLGYILWGVKNLFYAAIAVSFGGVLGGRLLNIPHASKVGVVGIAVVFVTGMAYLVLPGVFTAMFGAGCIG
jgi:hypothetical protein